MAIFKKLRELRPMPCGVRIGDIVELDGCVQLQIKCRKCTKMQGDDVFHYIAIAATP